MKERLKRKVKQNSAFTLVELMVVVAITVILLGVSMLSISRISTSLEMMELDNYAKTIYLEAQNQLAAKEVEGGLDKLYNRVIDECSDSRFLTEKPHDFGEVEEDYQGLDVYTNLCYVTKNDDITKVLIPEDSNMNELGGSYLIEFNPKTGDIYGVFYWEKDQVMNYQDDIVVGLFGRSQAERTSARIGYYGGRTESVVGSGIDFEQTVEMVNDEELYLKISFKDSSRLRRMIADGALTIDCLVQDDDEQSEDDYHINFKVTTTNYEFNTSDDTLDVFILLAGLESEYDIDTNSKEYEHTGLTAGGSLTATVTSSLVENNLGINLEQKDIVEDHSLFGKGTTGNTIVISSLRHLRNLDQAYYTHSAREDETITIDITNDIDFNNTNFVWNNGVHLNEGQARPDEVTGISPISNTSVLKDAVIEGNHYLLKNLVIQADEDGAGVFAATENVAISNLFIEDITLQTEQSNVGALVGTMTGGSITNCGVHLSVYELVEGIERYYSQADDPNGTDCHENEMEHYYDTKKVTGVSNVGGLVGFADGVTVTNSYAAVKTEGTTRATGGLIGYTKGITIKECYASGDVVGNIYAGGFIGEAIGETDAEVIVSECYAVGSVQGELSFAGFLGRSKYGIYTNCTSYGHISKASGGELTEDVRPGGFVNELYGSIEDNHNVYTTNGNEYTCNYMKQAGYNMEGLYDPSNVGAKGYGQFLAAEGSELGVGSTTSYNKSLFNQTYPFYKLDSQTKYYGNWPMPYVVDNALVYYEKYEDGSYGYYCVTRIADSENEWFLNTLDDTNTKTIVEDGYGILSKFYIGKFDIDLWVGSSEEKALDLTAIDEADGTADGCIRVSNAETYAAETDAANRDAIEASSGIVRLLQQGALTFYAHEDYNPQTGTFGEATGDRFTVSGLYLYRLPYLLQCTDRYGIDNFYDKLIINQAYLDTANLGNSTVSVMENVPFFYSPHFAMTAVNDSTADTLVSPNTAYVRTARHLNAMGRFSYYWNNNGGNNEKMTYQQMRDLNFSTYGTVVDGRKYYCGVEFDLLNINASYANHPIGHHNPSLFGEEVLGQFENKYNGNCYQIIDYALTSDMKYVGLFGSVMDAEIINVVMTVSSETASDGYEGNAGKIISVHDSPEGFIQDGFARATVGALIGMVETNSKTSNCIIQNCTSVGYDVEFQLLNSKLYQVAIGGLVGRSMADITNCSAENDIQLTIMNENAMLSEIGTSGDAFMGGLVGSFTYGTLSNCYAGGTICIDTANGPSNFADKVNVIVGGVTPGGISTTSETGWFGWEDRDTTNWSNLYSYSQIKDTNTLNLIDKLYTVAGRYYDYVLGSGYMTASSNTASNCYALELAWPYEPTGDNNIGDRVSYEYLSNTIFHAGIESLSHHVSDAGENATFPISALLKGETYPFPAVIKKGESYVHYGDWVVPTVTVTGSYPAYYEKYYNAETGEETYGYYYIEEDGDAVSTLVLDSANRIVETGYGEFRIQKEETSELLTTTISDCTFYLYPHTLETEASAISQSMTYDYVQAQVFNGKVFGILESSQKTLYYNTNFGAAISLSENLGKDELNPLQVRVKSHLENMGGLTVPSAANGEEQIEVFVKQTNYLYLENGHTPVNVNTHITYDGGKTESFSIQNAIANIFANNYGIIRNVDVINSRISGVETGAIFATANMGLIENVGVYGYSSYADSSIQGNNVYGFVVNNMASIQNSYVAGTIAGETEAAGFAGNNIGYITNCYANTLVSANADVNRAAGFVLNSNTADADGNAAAYITNCYAVGAVNAMHAYGFAESGVMNNCYTVANVTGTYVFGFADAENPENYTGCYWGYDENTAATDNGVGIRSTFSDIRDQISDYVAGEVVTVPYDLNLDGQNYPYPTVGLPHYGDWPVPAN